MVTVYQYIVFCPDLLCKINTKKHPPPPKKIITTTKKTKHNTLMINPNTCTVPYKKYLELYFHLKNPLIGCRHSISAWMIDVTEYFQYHQSWSISLWAINKRDWWKNQRLYIQDKINSMSIYFRDLKTSYACMHCNWGFHNYFSPS